MGERCGGEEGPEPEPDLGSAAVLAAAAAAADGTCAYGDRETPAEWGLLVEEEGTGTGREVLRTCGGGGIRRPCKCCR